MSIDQIDSLDNDIAETIRESLVVLDSDLKILKANHRFYDTFKLTPEATLDHLIYDLGIRQWDMPKLRALLEDILLQNDTFENYEIEHVFPDIGYKVMVFNARRILRRETDAQMIILAIEDATERRRMEEEIREISLRDQLTELLNRHGFIIFAEQQFKTAKRTKRQMMLAFIGVDDMKSINDKLGHEEGDRVLVDTANILRQTFRESDIIGRIGGDEFAVLSNETTDISPKVIGERLKRCLDAHNLERSRGGNNLSLSVGMALYSAENPSSLDEMMAQANTLMRAKKSMKNRRGLQ